MKLLIFIILGLATIGGLPAATPTPNAIPDEALKVLRSHNSATFYSLEPWERPKPEDKTLHGYKILGKTTLDPKNEQVVEGAFEKAVSNWDGMIANCFDPRHALSLSSSGHIYDFLLCYNCHQLYIYKDDKVIASMGAAGSPKFLNSILAAAHVPVSQTDTEEQQAAEQKKFQEDNARWLAAMPKSLQPSWNARSSNPFPNIFPLREPLTQEYPDVTQRILKLLEWYGSGAGPCLVILPMKIRPPNCYTTTRPKKLLPRFNRPHLTKLRSKVRLVFLPAGIFPNRGQAIWLCYQLRLKGHF